MYIVLFYRASWKRKLKQHKIAMKGNFEAAAMYGLSNS
jgi:hypothetical protein